MKAYSTSTGITRHVATVLMLTAAFFALTAKAAALETGNLAVYAGETLWLDSDSIVDGSVGAEGKLSFGRAVSISGDALGHAEYSMNGGSTVGGTVIVSGDFSCEPGNTFGGVQAGGTFSFGSGSVCGYFRAVGESYVAPDAIINGDAYSGSSLTLGRQVAVHGDVFHKGSYWADSGVVIDGDVTSVTTVPSIDSWTFEFVDTAPQSSVGDSVWYADDTVQSLTPGDYGQISAGKRVEIHLTSAGTYNFRSISVGENTEFISDIESGTIVVNVQNALSANSGAQFIYDSESIQMEIHTGGSVWFGSGCSVDADVYAGGDLSLGSDVNLYGIAHCAKVLSFGQRVHVFGRQSEGDDGCTIILPDEEILAGMTNQPVSSNLLSLVASALPESQFVDHAYLDPAYDMNLTLSEEGRVSVTFIDEGASYRNSMGYYAYPAGALDGLTKADVDIDGSGVVSPCELAAATGAEYGWVFPNASKAGSGGSLQSGDTVMLADGKVFEAGTVIGFFLVQNSWTGSEVSIDSSRQIFYTTDFLNPEAGSDADSQTDSSANRSRHVAMLFADNDHEDIIMGIEDLNRLHGSDDDFNDAVFIVRSDPPDALEDSGIPSIGTSSFTTEKLLAFEDLKLKNWCDWDYNDVLLDVSGTCETNAYGHVYSMTLEYEMLARGAGYDHEVYVSFDAVGASSSTVTTYSADGTLLAQSAETHDGSLTLELFSSSKNALPPSDSRYDYANTERLKQKTLGTRVKVTLVFDEPALNPFGKMYMAPYDTWIHVVKTGRDIHRPLFQLAGNLQLCPEGPLAGQALPLALDFDAGFDWPAERIGVWESHEEFVDYIESGMLEHDDWWRTFKLGKVWEDDNHELPGIPYEPVVAAKALSVASLSAKTATASLAASGAWPLDLGAKITASPICRDLNGDGEPEILLADQNGAVHILTADGTEFPGWPQQCEFGLRASPGVGNIDDDPEPEIVIGTDAGGTNGFVRAWNLDGSVVSGFPIEMGAPVKCVPTVMDVNGDGASEIVVYAGDRKLYVFDADGNTLPGWPVRLSGDADSYGAWLLASSPVVCDLDGDGSMEICAGSSGGDVYAFHADGSKVNGWPKETDGDSVYSSITLADLNGDFKPELVVGSGDGKVYAWYADGTSVVGYPVDLGNPIIASVAAADLDGIDGEELVAFTAGMPPYISGQIYVLGSDGKVLSGWPQNCASSYRSITPSPVLADVDGDGLPDIIAGSTDKKLHAWDIFGNVIDGFPYETSGIFESTPLAADLDSDGNLELIFCSHDGLVRKLDIAGTSAPWPCFRGDRALGVDSDALDVDNDGLADTFEVNTFGNLRSSAKDDFDGDGLSNAAELVASTDPTDASSTLALKSTRRSDGDFVSWDARPGCTYTIEACCDLSTGEWQTVAEGLTGDGVLEWTASATNSCVFYRLTVSRR